MEKKERESERVKKILQSKETAEMYVESGRCERQEADDGERVKRRREEEFLTDRRADTWPQSAGRWEGARRRVSSRDGAAYHNLSRATRTPGRKKEPLIIYMDIIHICPGN